MKVNTLWHPRNCMVLATILLTLSCNSTVNLDPSDTSTGVSDVLEAVEDVKDDDLATPTPDTVTDLLEDVGPVSEDTVVDLLDIKLDNAIEDPGEDMGTDSIEPDLFTDVMEEDIGGETDGGGTGDSDEFWGILDDGANRHIVRFNWGDPTSMVSMKKVPFILFTELEFDGEGNLWAWNCKNGYAGGELYLVGQQTGDLEYIGDSPVPLDDLAWNPVDGQMYGVRPWSAMVSGHTELYTVELATGQTTLVGSIIDDGPAQIGWMSGLGINSSGEFYYYNNTHEGPGKNEQGIFLSEGPTGLDAELLYTFSEQLSEPAGAFQIGPVFVDWSRDNVGYSVVRYDPTGSTTHTYHLTFDDHGVLEADKHKLQAFGILRSVTRKPQQ